MSRPLDGWTTLGAAIARVAAVEPPAWVSESTATAVGLALAGLTRDARIALAGRTTREAPAVLGLSRRALMTALAGGWLSGEEPPR